MNHVDTDVTLMEAIITMCDRLISLQEMELKNENMRLQIRLAELHGGTPSAPSKVEDPSKTTYGDSRVEDEPTPGELPKPIPTARTPTGKPRKVTKATLVRDMAIRWIKANPPNEQDSETTSEYYERYTSYLPNDRDRLGTIKFARVMSEDLGGLRTRITVNKLRLWVWCMPR